MNPDLSSIYHLYLLGQQAALGVDAGEARNRLLSYVVTLFVASSGSLWEINEEGTELCVVAHLDVADHPPGKRVPMGSGLFGWVAANGKPLLLYGDRADDPRIDARAEWPGAQVPGSALCWPLMVESQPIGVISVARRPDQPPYSAEDLDNGYHIVRFLAIAVENTRLHIRSARYVAQLRDLVDKLEQSQAHLIQAGKMASLGQLAAGVAHEINNPVGYISSNLNALDSYVSRLIEVLDAYEARPSGQADDTDWQHKMAEVRLRAEPEFLKHDMRALINESQEGIRRVRQIVQNLKDFSHVDQTAWTFADLHAGLESTLNIVHNELKYKADVVREYGELPPIECLLSQLNQVFMNILVNAAQAMEKRGVITIRTGHNRHGWVWVEIGDTGPGIEREHLSRIFEPFFTTKPVGMGTGLGLWISYGIIKKHGGRIEVDSKPGEGATFRIWLPVAQAVTPAPGKTTPVPLPARNGLPPA